MHSVPAHFVETQLPWLPQQVTAHQSGTAILRHLVHCGKMIPRCTALYICCGVTKASPMAGLAIAGYNSPTLLVALQDLLGK